MHREPSDEELVQRCLHDDRDAWETLVLRYGRLVYGLGARAGLSPDDSADLFQTVFLTAYRNLHLLDRPESLQFWLSTIARREAWQAKRKLARERGPAAAGWTMDPDLAGGTAEIPSPLPAADEEMERTERLFLLERGMERLSARCRRLLDYLFFKEPAPSYQEAARALGIPLGSVGPSRARCLKKLKSILGELGF